MAFENHTGFLKYYDYLSLDRDNLKAVWDFRGTSSGKFNGTAGANITFSESDSFDENYFTIFSTFNTINLNSNRVLFGRFQFPYGWVLGLNKANKAYIQYFKRNGISGCHVFNVDLQKRSAIALSRSNNVFTFYKYNFLGSESDKDSFSFGNSSVNVSGGSTLMVGGNPNYVSNPTYNVGSADAHYSGLFDFFSYIDTSLYPSSVDILFSGVREYTNSSSRIPTSTSGFSYVEKNFTNFSYFEDGLKKSTENVRLDLNSSYNSNLFDASGHLTGSSNGTSLSLNGYYNLYNSSGNLFSTNVYSISDTLDVSGPLATLDLKFRFTSDGIENSNLDTKIEYSDTSNSVYQTGYVNVAQVWPSATNDITENLSYASNFKNNGLVLTSNKAQNYGPSYTGDFFDNFNSLKMNVVPNRSLLDQKYLTKNVETGAYLNIDGQESLVSVTSKKIQSALTGVSFAYDSADRGTTPSASSIFSNSYLSTNFFPNVSKIQSASGRLFLNEDYQEVSSIDLLYNKSANINYTGDFINFLNSGV